MSEDNKSNCCPSTLPPVTTSDYIPKGTYEEITSIKTYITGSPTASRGIINVYDVFGFMPQTLQGADRLAASLDAVVLVPDFLKGSYAQAAWFSGAPMDEETKKASEAFMSWMAFPNHMSPLLQITQAAKGKFPEAKGWACFGLCWGGKLTAMSSGADTPFKVSGQAHPARPTREDVEAMAIPHICLAAPTDNKDGGIDAYKEVFSQRGRVGEVETYPTMFHGWMGGRSNLEDAENAKEFERGYNQVAAFFAKHF